MLSPVKIKSLKPKGAPYRVADVGGSCKGLGVNVSAKGHKSFVLAITHEKVRYRIKIGDVGKISLAEARKAAMIRREKVESGLFDPGENHRINSKRKLTNEIRSQIACFDELLDGYLDHLRNKDAASVLEVERVFNREIIKCAPEIIALPANDITPQIIADLIRRIATRPKPPLTVATHMRAYLHAAFNWAIAADLDPLLKSNGNKFQISNNPVSPVPKPKKGNVSIDRFLKEEEVRLFWNLLLEHSTPVPVAALRLQLATGQRVREVLSLRWNQIERVEGRYIWFMPKTKNGRPHEVPLNAMAAEILDWLRPVTGNCQVVFPKRHSKTTPTDSTVLNNVIRKIWLKTGMQRFTPRDLRRTVKTLAIKNGISKSDMDMLQNHALASDVSSKHYVRYEYLPERKLTADKWGKILSKIISNDSATDLESVSQF
jgi:integrase